MSMRLLCASEEREVKVIFSGGKRSVLYIGVSMGMQGKRLMAVFRGR